MSIRFSVMARYLASLIASSLVWKELVVTVIRRVKSGCTSTKVCVGKILVSPRYDFLRTPYVYVDDLVSMPVIAQCNGKLGLILPDYNDTIVAPFEYDDISLREEPPYFETKKGKVKGYLDIDGSVVKLKA